MNVRLMLGDIVAVEADAIVNAANAQLAGGGGVDGAIHRAGGPAIMEACRRIGGCPTGDAVRTEAGRLRARWVIHAVAPMYRARPEDPALLRSAYEASLREAEAAGAQSIAFPSLGTGAYGYPVEEAAPIALAVIKNHVPQRLRDAVFVLFSEHHLDVYRRALAQL